MSVTKYQGANRPGGELSRIQTHLGVGESTMGRIVHRANRPGANRLGGESTMGRIDHRANRPGGESSSVWAKRPWGEKYIGRNVWKPRAPNQKIFDDIRYYDLLITLHCRSHLMQ